MVKRVAPYGGRFVDKPEKQVPDTCKGCYWRRGQVCMFSSCVKDDIATYMKSLKNSADPPLVSNEHASFS